MRLGRSAHKRPGSSNSFSATVGSLLTVRPMGLLNKNKNILCRKGRKVDPGPLEMGLLNKNKNILCGKGRKVDPGPRNGAPGENDRFVVSGTMDSFGGAKPRGS